MDKGSKDTMKSTGRKSLEPASEMDGLLVILKRKGGGGGKVFLQVLGGG